MSLPRNPNADKIEALINAAPRGFDPDWDEVSRLIAEGWESGA